MKRGFGLLEVIVASLVLGFLVVALNNLQKGNRENILRVRARDAANFVAQHVLDSISASGLKSLEISCDLNPTVYSNPDYIYHFEGKPQLNKKTDGIKVETRYNVEISCVGNAETIRNTSKFKEAIGIGNAPDTISQSLEAVVAWQHKSSTQSIKMTKVVR